MWARVALLSHLGPIQMRAFDVFEDDGRHGDRYGAHLKDEHGVDRPDTGRTEHARRQHEGQIVPAPAESGIARVRVKWHAYDRHALPRLPAQQFDRVSLVVPAIGLVREAGQDDDVVTALAQALGEIVHAKRLGPEVLGDDQHSHAGTAVPSTRS